MLNKNSTAYTFGFATLICVVCSFLLAFVSGSLRSKQELNMEVDIKKNVLKAVSLVPPLPAGARPSDVLATYAAKIDELVLDNQGHILNGKRPEDINFDASPDLMPLYIYKEQGVVKAYCYPVIGKGLWSTLYGYFAVEPDAKTVRGITFYKHGETPGLGAEIDKSWFQDNFKGKIIWSKIKKELTPVVVVKGKVSDFYTGDQAKYRVDGISGATITSRGVTDLLDVAIKKYEPFFKEIRK